MPENIEAIKNLASDAILLLHRLWFFLFLPSGTSQEEEDAAFQNLVEDIDSFLDDNEESIVALGIDSEGSDD